MKRFISFIAAIVFCIGLSACDFTLLQRQDYSDTEYAAFVNNVTNSAVKSTVKVISEIYNTSIFGNITSGVKNQGSGVIIELKNNNYYLLTNNHVVDKNGYSNRDLSIIDCYGNSYTARYIYSSVDDDLALLSFSASELKGEVSVMEFAEENAKIGDIVAAIGAPDGQFNSVTLGYVTNYRIVALDQSVTSSHVTYSVITHSAAIDHGSSGGVLINTDLKIVGINFAGGVDLEENFTESYAIPLDKVQAFLALATA